MRKMSLVAVLVTMLFIGCSEKELVKPIDVRDTYINPELDGAPAWVSKPYVEGYVAELGSAAKNAGNDIAFQREEAMANARDNLASSIEIKINNMFKAFKSVTGGGRDATFDNSSEKVSKQVASQSLSGTRIQDVWFSKSGTLYVLMVIDDKYVSDVIDKTINTSYKNDKALHQIFKMKSAQKELNEEIQ